MTNGTPAGMAGLMLRQPFDLALLMVNVYAEMATAFWSLWGPLGEPVIAAVDLIADMQRRWIAATAEMIGGMAAVR